VFTVNLTTFLGGESDYLTTGEANKQIITLANRAQLNLQNIAYAQLLFLNTYIKPILFASKFQNTFES